ncbi:MAG TPA: TraR/DksA C4-type zinc finger protein [Tepidisphaeraceae bacterium]
MAKKLVKKPAVAGRISKPVAPNVASRPLKAKAIPAAKAPQAKPVASRTGRTAAAKPVVAKPAPSKPANGKPTNGKAAVAPATPKAVKQLAKVAPAPVVAPRPAAVARPSLAVKPPVNGIGTTSAKPATKSQSAAGLSAEPTKPVLKLNKPVRIRPEPIPVRLPPAPVRSDSKMARNRAGITARELEHFRDLLFEKRRELTGDVSSMETSALRNSNGSLSTLPMHMADAGTDNYEQEFTLGLVEKDRKLLRDINLALAKIQDGSYGICEGTGKPISKPRLEAQPWAKYSIEHARQLERSQFRRAF